MRFRTYRPPARSLSRSSTRSLTLCAAGSALSFVLLWLGTVTGVLDMSAAVLCGVITHLLVDQTGPSRAACSVAVCCVLCAVLVPDKTVPVLYICVGGIYPLIRPRAQKLGRLARRAVKCIAATLSILIYCVSLYIFIPSEAGKYLVPAALVLGGACFFLYDVLLERFLMIYRARFCRRRR